MPRHSSTTYVDAKLAVEAARLCNDGFAKLIAHNPSRFSAWAFLPMQDPAAAVAELRRCVRDYGFVGGLVGTNVRGTYLPDETLQPIFDVASELDVPLFLHPVDPPGRDRTNEYELTVVAGYLFDSTINIFRMICSNFLDRYGSIKLVCAHTGAFSLMLSNRMQREVQTNATLSRMLPRKIDDYLRDFYFDTVCFDPEYLRLRRQLRAGRESVARKRCTFSPWRARSGELRPARTARGTGRPCARRQLRPPDRDLTCKSAGSLFSAIPFTAKAACPRSVP